MADMRDKLLMAQQVRRLVDIRLVNGDRLPAVAVLSVREHDATVDDPQYFGDDDTRREIDLHDVVSADLTDMEA